MAEILTEAAAALQTALDGALTKLLVVATGNAVSLPPSIADTGKPLVLSGTVVPPAAGSSSTGSQSQLSIQTSAGQVTVSLDSPLAQPPRGTVAVAIQPGSPPTATILAPTAQQAAQTAASPQAVSAQDAVNLSVQTVAQSASALPPLLIGQVVAAVVIPVADPGLVQHASTPTTGVLPIAPVAATGSGTQAKLGSDIILPNAIAPSQAGSSGSALVDRRFNPDQGASGQEEDAEEGAGAEEATSSPAAASPAPLPPPQTSAFAATLLASAEADEPVQTPGQPLAYSFQAAQGAAQPQRFVILNIVGPEQEPAQVSSQAAVATRLVNTADDPVETTVVAQTSTGQPVLAARSQTLVMTEPASVAIGAQVTLRPLAQAAATTPAPATTALPAPYNPLPLAAGGRVEWPALAQLMAALPATQPQALQALAEILPRVNGDFVQRFVAFATAQRAGGIPSTALPDALARAEAGQEPASSATARLLTGLLSQLHQDLSVSAKAGSPSTPSHWQAMSVPVLSGERLDAIQMFVRRQVDPDETAEDDKDGKPDRRAASTRFLVEVSPSRLGPVQLDGLLRTQRDATLRLDMVVRPASPLTPEQGHEIDGLFQTALNAAGLRGSLKLQPGREGFVLPRSDDDGGHVSRMA
jgi:hypothetical protein